MPLTIHDDVPLAPLTTLELGGPARHLAVAASEDDVRAGLELAATRGLPVFVLGGGSNLVVADAGFPGLVLQPRLRGVRFEVAGGAVLVRAAAGEPWDELVAETVGRDLAGLECLSGIPGLVGATPIQNVGAYGQEVADTIRSVRAYDRAAGRPVELTPADCAFGYRDSALRRAPERFVVLEVVFALRPGGAATVAYPELARALAGAPRPSLGEVRAAVLALRKQKSMVVDPADENRRSAGSFFVNPIVAATEADAVAARAIAGGCIADPAALPRFPAPGGAVKLAAGWLVEQAGVPRGFRRGAVGVSSRHALALVHHGGGSTADLLDLARHVRDTVRARFGVVLRPEPTLLGARIPE